MARPRQKFQPFRPNQMAVDLFFRERDAGDEFIRQIRAQTPTQNLVVALAEISDVLLVSQRDIFSLHHLLPGFPVKIGRVNQCSIQIPNYRSFVIVHHYVCRLSSLTTPRSSGNDKRKMENAIWKISRYSARLTRVSAN